MWNYRGWRLLEYPKVEKNNRIRRIGGDKGGYWEVL